MAECRLCRMSSVAVTSKGGGILRRRKLSETLDELLEKDGTEPIPSEPPPAPMSRRSGRSAALDPADLRHRRDNLLGILEGHWPTIGRNLGRARNRVDIAEALRPLAGSNQPTIDLLLLDAFTKAMPENIRVFRQQQKTLAARFSESYGKLDLTRRLEQEAREAYSQAHVTLAAARAAHAAARKKKKPAGFLLKEFERRSSIYERLSAEVKKREDRVNQCTEELRGVQIEIRAIEAHFAQTELLRFLKSRKYAFTPENVANAAAGLPQLGCRRSFLLCSRGKCTAKRSINYILFEAVSKILKKQDATSAEEATKEIRRQINTRKQFAILKEYLSEHWPALEEATHKVWSSPAHPKARPFQITSLFLATLRAPRPVIHPLLDALEKELAPT